MYIYIYIYIYKHICIDLFITDTNSCPLLITCRSMFFLLVFVYKNKHSGKCDGSGLMLACTRHTSSTPHTSPIHQMSPSRHRSSAISFFESKHQHLAPLFDSKP